MFTVHVENKGDFIALTVIGQPTLELAKSVMDHLGRFLAPGQKARLLYDVRQLKVSPNLEIAEFAKRFHSQISPLVSRLAVVVADYEVLSRVEMIFVNFDQHRIFYDADSAERWLREGA
jgi:hypothetical protein